MATFEEYTKNKNKKKKKQSFTEYTKDVLGRDDIEAPTYKTYKVSYDDISPIKRRKNRLSNSVTPEAVDKMLAKVAEDRANPSKRTWFSAGAFDDGYDFGDLTKSVYSSISDLHDNLGAGILKIGEGVIDTGAYIAGGVGGLFGADDFKKSTKKFIAKDIINEEKISETANYYTRGDWIWDNVLGIEDTDDYSFYGEKSDSLVQSAGQLGGTIALQSVGVPWWATTGVTSFGRGAETALNEGASFGEAGLVGVIDAGADILTEKLFGGSGLGEKGLINLGGLSKNISGKATKLAVDYGLDIVGEGTEEVAAEFFQNLGSSLYKEENLKDILFNEEAVDQYLESFVGGAVLGGGMNVNNVVTSAKEGTDYRTGLTESEQKVFDKVYNDAIAEAEKGGKTLTPKEKTEIYTEIMENLQKGYVPTNTIEEVLGGENYTSYKGALDSENALQEEFNALNKMKQSEMTGEQIDRRAELKQQLEDLKNNSNKDGLKTQLSDGISNLINGDIGKLKSRNSYLAESYNEQTRRGTAFETDLSKVEEKYRDTYKNAVESGILNNTRRTHEMVEFLAKISADKGTPFEFANNEKIKNSSFAVEGAIVNGYKTTNADGKTGIAINIESPKYINTIVGHEITHILEGTELYDTLQNTITEYAKSKGDYQSRYDALTELYKNVKDANVDAELTADLVGDYLFTDKDFIRKLSTEHRNVFQKVYDEIKYLCKVATAGSKEARQLEKVKKTFAEVYRESGKAETKTGTQHSLSADTQGKQLTEGQKEFFKDSKAVDDNGNLVMLYHGTENGGFTKFDAKYSDDGLSLFFTDSTELASTYSGNVDEVAPSPDKKGLAKLFERTGKGKGQKGLYKVYLNLKNPLIVDAQGRSWSSIPYGNVKEVTTKVTENGDNITFERNIGGEVETATFSKQEVLDAADAYFAEYENVYNDLVESDWTDEIEMSVISKSLENLNDNPVISYLTSKNNDGNSVESQIHMMRSAASLWKAQKSDSARTQTIQNEMFDMDELVSRNYNTRDLAKIAKEGGYDGVIIKNVMDASGLRAADVDYSGLESGKNVYIAFDSNQVKSIYNANPTANPDIRYSLTEDTNGNKLSKEQQEYFGLSKVVDESGKLKVMYHGTSQGGHTVFDTYGSKYGLFGQGTYFTDSKSVAETYTNKGKGENKQVYESYLNIKNPMDMDSEANAEAWAKAFPEASFPESGTNEEFYRAMEEYFEDNEYSRAEAAEMAIEALEGMGFDGITHIGGGRVNANSPAHRVYVAFKPEQIKNIDNAKPTDNPDIRFSLSEAVEETKDLIAVHNLSEEKLAKSLKLGGLPMPSIAIARAKDGYTDFGKISLVFNKETVDPQFMRSNKVYSGDAWTPVYPRIEYKVSRDTVYKVQDKISELFAGTDYEDAFGYLGLDTDNIQDYLNRNGGDIYDAYGKKPALKLAFLKDNGIELELPTKQEQLSDRFDNDVVVKFAEKYGEEKIRELNNSDSTSLFEKYIPEVKEIVEDYYSDLTGEKMEWQIGLHDVYDFLDASLKYFRRGIRSKTDASSATRQIIDEAVDETAYKKWLDELFSGIIEKEGIRNNKDLFTPSGNRRSFEVLHYEHNLENVIKAMKDGGEKGLGAFGGGNIFGASTTEYNSIAEIKEDAKSRMKQMSESEYEEIRKGFSDRFFELAYSLPIHKDSFTATDDAANMLIEAVAKFKTKSGMANYLRNESKGWANYSDYVVDDLIQLVGEISQMPVGYFEAKPQRAVGFDEVATAIIPDNASDELKQMLADKGIKFVEYESGNEQARLEVLNSLEDAKFSLSENGEKPTKFGNFNISGKDVALPVQESVIESVPTEDIAEDFAPTETVSEEVAPVVVEEKTPTKTAGNRKTSNAALKRYILQKPAKRLDGKIDAATQGAIISNGKQYMSHNGRFIVELNTPDESIPTNDKLNLGSIQRVIEMANKNAIEGNYEIDAQDISRIRKEAPKGDFNLVNVDGNCFDINYVDAVLEAIENPKISLSNLAGNHKMLVVKGSNGQAYVAPVNISGKNLENVNFVYEAAPMQDAIPDDYAPITEDEANAMARETLDTLDDADAPPVENNEYYDMPDTTRLDDTALKNISKSLQDTLFLDRKETKAIQEVVQKYSTTEFPSREELFDEIKREFGEKVWQERNEEIADVKAFLRSYRINVSEQIKHDITDYNSFQKSHFRKVLFANDGISVDTAYQELSEMYPDFFPESITNPTDQLLAIAEVADMDINTEMSEMLDDDIIQEAVNIITAEVNNYKQAETMAEAEHSASDYLNDIAPLREPKAEKAYEAIRPKAETAYEAIKPEKPKATKEPRLIRVKDADTAQRTAEVLTEEPKVEKQKNKGWSKFVSNFVDKGAVFEKLSLKKGNKAIDDKYNFMRYSESRAQNLIGKGADGVKSLNDIRTEVERTGKTKAFYDYLYHKHNVDRMSLEGRYDDVENKPVFGYSVTSEASQEIVNKYESTDPRFKQYANDVYAYLGYLRQQLVDNGVISQETADLWSEMYPHYVPIRRVGDEGLNINVPLDSNKTGINAPVKRATGGNRDILPLFDTMAQRTMQTFKATAKNSFGVELKNTLGTVIESQKAGIDEVLDSVDTHEELLQEGKDGKNPTFTVFENGERVTFEITEEMYDALKPTGKGLAYTNKVLNKASNLHRGVLTEYNPAFMLTNAVKDIQDVFINSKHPAHTYANVPIAAAQMLAKKGKYYNEYIKNGGEQNTYFEKQSNSFKEKGALRKIVGFPLDMISSANNFVERIPRLAEYMASRKAGRSVEGAMLDSARVTTNFAAGGDVTKFLNRNGVTFLNASVQGFTQQVRNVREAKANGLKGWIHLAAKYSMAGLAPMLLNHLLWDDDDDYAELSDYVKDNYYIVGKMNDGQFVRIPKGRAISVIQEAFEQVSNALTGKDDVDLKNFLDLAMTNLAPNNPIDNNIIAPIMQVKNNETWYGEDLVPTRLQDLPAEEQYDESTDSISRWLGEKMNYSPYKLNYLLNQYGGIVGDVVLPMLTPEAERGDNSLKGNLIAPLKDKFTTDAVMNNQNVSNFYDTVDELTKNAKSSYATDEDVLKYKYINSVNADLGELYAKKREIQNSSLSDQAKYSAVRELQKEINALAKDSLNTYNNVSIQDGYATVGDLHYRWYEPSENSDAEAGWQKITDKQLEKQEKVTRGLGISASEYWGNKEEYDYAYESPEKYAVAKSVGGYDAYRSYISELYDIRADKDESGKSISGSRKKKVVDYINNLDADYGERIILFKSEYPADDTYNYEIVEYLNSRDDISYKEMEAILKELGFTVKKDGTISW